MALCTYRLTLGSQVCPKEKSEVSNVASNLFWLEVFGFFLNVKLFFIPLSNVLVVDKISSFSLNSGFSESNCRFLVKFGKPGLFVMT